jgi:FAD/FMN-containing dehydrogenase
MREDLITAVIRRGDDEYDALRRSLVWNERVPDRYPDVIYRPSTAEDLARLLREEIPADKKISVRAGGHNWLATSLRDGGALLDLGKLNTVSVDVESRLAQVGPGATHQVLADAIAPRGLAFPIGHCPSVGLGGYLLAGGMGWNLHEWGTGSANIRGADVVFADGHSARIDDEHDPDLFWALRGGSTGFPGIVTSFLLELKELPQIFSRHIAHPLDRLPELLEKVSVYLPEAPGVEIAVVVRRPIDDRTKAPQFILAATAFGATQDAARARLDTAVTALDADRADLSGTGAAPVAFNQLEGEGGWEKGLRYFADTTWATSPVRDIGQLAADAITAAPSAESRIVIAFAHSPSGLPDTSFTRLGDMTVNFYATWRNQDDDQANIDWVRTSSTSLSAISDRHYIGESDLSAAPGRVALSYPADKFEQLTEIIHRYDPAGRFHSFLERS